jgi:hypothetical protein
MAAGLVHILLDQPGHRGNITIPGPFGSLRVAILTGLFQDAHHGGIDIGAGEQWPSELVFSPNGWMKADATASTPAHAMA